MESALKWLATVQNKNGSWGLERKTFAEQPGHPAHTGLALLVFLAHGETPVSAKYGDTTKKAISWLRDYGAHKGMETKVRRRFAAYTHGIATLALGEAYAMTHQEDLKGPLVNCVNAIIKGQMKNGGFAYSYSDNPRWDMSVSGWNIQALTTAHMAGCQNPGLAGAIKKANNFCKIAYGGKGGFGYASRPGNTPNMGGIGTLSLILVGADGDKCVTEGCKRIGTIRVKDLDMVKKDPAKWSDIGSKCLYGWYYETQALYHAKKKNPTPWRNWNRAYVDVLKKAQHKDGYWETKSHGTGPTPAGRVISTSWAALQLAVEYRYSLDAGAGKALARRARSKSFADYYQKVLKKKSASRR